MVDIGSTEGLNVEDKVGVETWNTISHTGNLGFICLISLPQYSLDVSFQLQWNKHTIHNISYVFIDLRGFNSVGERDLIRPIKVHDYWNQEVSRSQSPL